MNNKEHQNSASDEPVDWREALYRVLLLGTTVGGLFIAVVLGLVIATDSSFAMSDWWATYFFYAGVIALNFLHSLSHRVRTRILAACLLGIGWSSSLLIGVDTGPILICFLAVLVSGLLLSPVTAGLGLFVSALVMGMAASIPDPLEVPAFLTATAFAGTTFAGVVLVRHVVTQLERQLARRSSDLKRLQRETAQRAEAEKSLQAVRERLEEAQRFEAIGRVAGGVAHEFNNLLQVIIAWTEALETTTDPTEREEMMRDIRGATLEAGEITADLLSVARRGSHQREVIQLDERLRVWVGGWKRILPPTVELHVRVEAVGPCEVNDGLVQQGLLNLIRNAADRDVGSTRIEVKLSPSSDHAFVELRVTDNGCGMDQEQIVRVFEPFYTTKGARGTGLGLSIVRGTIEQVGGTVSLTSEVGKGTSVLLRIPTSERQPVLPEILPVGEPTTMVSLAGTRVLLVEDEKALRRAAERVFRQHDASVASCADGDEAMEALQKGDDFQMLCIDAHMPGASTLSVIENYLRNDASGRVLVCSGNVRDKSLRDYVQTHGIQVLTKPYSQAQLLDAVATLYREVEGGA